MDGLFDSAKSSAKSMKRSLTGAEPETPMEELDAMCTCSYRTRLIGFFSCLVVGLILTFVSLLMFGSIVLHPARFASLYTLGNIVSLAGTGFIVGPWRQVKAMAKPTRFIAAIVYVLSLIGTLVACFAIDPPSAILCIICVIVQFCALWWYSLSYIPFARKMVSSLLGRCIKS